MSQLLAARKNRRAAAAATAVTPRRLTDEERTTFENALDSETQEHVLDDDVRASMVAALEVDDRLRDTETAEADLNIAATHWGTEAEPKADDDGIKYYAPTLDEQTAYANAEIARRTNKICWIAVGTLPTALILTWLLHVIPLAATLAGCTFIFATCKLIHGALFSVTLGAVKAQTALRVVAVILLSVLLLFSRGEHWKLLTSCSLIFLFADRLLAGISSITLPGSRHAL